MDTVAAPTLSDEEPLNVYVLFIDIVDSTREASDRQQAINTRLTALISGTRAFQEARSNGDLISLPTGDGMALVFLKKMQSPLRCAIEIAQALRSDPFCNLRMGIHAGLVFASEDINGKRNVSGAGINMAERVMSCGAGGHILVSSTAAESLRHLTAWRSKLTDLGEFRAKKDTVHIWNFVDGDVGSTRRLPALSVKMVEFRNRALGVAVLFVPMVLLYSYAFFMRGDLTEHERAFALGGGGSGILAPLIILSVRWFLVRRRIDPKRSLAS